MNGCEEGAPHNRLITAQAIGRGAVGEDVARIGAVHTEVVVPSLLFSAAEVLRCPLTKVYCCSAAER